MTDDLTKKLEEILVEAYSYDLSLNGGMPDDINYDVEKITQAFIAAGWMPSDKERELKIVLDNLNDEFERTLDTAVKVLATKLPNTMTGQEWYDRFGKELAAMGAFPPDCQPALVASVAAAKKASGIEIKSTRQVPPGTHYLFGAKVVNNSSTITEEV